MFFRQRINDDASISYFFGCGGHGKAVAVDALAGDDASFIDQAQKMNVAIAAVIDIHIHADHLFATAVTANVPPRPADMDRLVAINLDRHAVA